MACLQHLSRLSLDFGQGRREERPTSGRSPFGRRLAPTLFKRRSQPGCKQHSRPTYVGAFLGTARSSRACPPILRGVGGASSEIVDSDGVVEKIVEMYVYLRGRIKRHLVSFVVDDVFGDEGAGNGREAETAVHVNPG